MADTRILVDKTEAMRMLGGIGQQTFDQFFASCAIRLGNKNFYKPSDLEDRLETILSERGTL